MAKRTVPIAYENQALLERCAYLIVALQPFADLSELYENLPDKNPVKLVLSVDYLRAAKKAIDESLRTDFSKKGKVK